MRPLRSRRVTPTIRQSPPHVERLESRLLLAVDALPALASGWNLMSNVGTASAAGFQIEVVFPDSTLSASQKQVFSQAAARWGQIIVGDLPDVTFEGSVIDDIRVTAVGVTIDGQYGTLGTGGPTWTGGDPRPPSRGSMTFDTADLPRMESEGTLFAVVLHEMGHALGLGTMWSYRNLLGSGGYIGTNALREYRSLFNLPSASSIPTAGSGHWDETKFDTELMTPIAEQAGTPQPVSRMTVGSLEDLGYTVNYAAADPFPPTGGTPSISISDITLAEGNAGTASATLTIKLSTAASGQISVKYATADGTATTADDDFTAASGGVTFAAGETVKTVSVTIKGDTKSEADESFSVTLSDPVGASLGKQSGTVTITNDDDAPPPPATPTLSVGDVSVVEGNSGSTQAAVTIKLSAAATGAVTVGYSTVDDTATTADNDYSAASGTVTFAAGETQKTVVVTVNGDTKAEPNEQFAFKLSNAQGATIDRATATVTITNDDSTTPPPPPASATISVNDVTVTEGNSGTMVAEFTVSLSAAATAPVTVSFRTADGTATTADRDYLATVGRLTFARGETTKKVRVFVYGDTKNEAAESFSLVLSSPTNATIAKDRGTGTISNDDTPPRISVSIADASIREGNSGQRILSFVVNLSTAAREAITLRVQTADGTATAGSDYVALASRNLVFGRGMMRQSVSVWVNGDRTFEQDETFTVSISEATGASIGRATATGRLLNDDPASAPALVQLAAWAQFAQAEVSASAKTGTVRGR